VVVSGPNAFNATPTFQGVNIGTNGTPRVATYRLTPPGGTWTTDDNGTYTIAMVANQVKDTSNNAVVSGVLGGFTVSVDTVAPVISGITSSGITHQVATISWTTNEISDTQVEYGTTAAYGTTTVLSDTSPRLTSHTVNLSGLAASTTYHYRVKSTDAAGNQTVSADQTFSTTAAPDATVPTATLIDAPDVTTGGGTTYSIQIEYQDDVSLDVSTIGTGDITVSGPGSFLATPSFVSVDNATNGQVRTATYQFTPPGGSWTTDDNGTYTISMVGNQVKDTSGNPVTDAVPTGTLGTFTVSVDTVAPVLSSIQSTGVLSTSATVSWTSDEAADTQVEYGTTAAYGSTTTLADTSPRVTSHSVNLSGLSSSTLYHYRVKSRDAAGNLATSSDRTFTTTAPPDLTAPTASLTLAPDVTTSGNSYDIKVTYSDNVAVDVASITTGDITVDGPNSFSAIPSMVSVNTAGNGTPRVATYRFTPPGGTWTTEDNGTYTISMAANQVKDTSGNWVAAGTLGTFAVSVDTVAPDISAIAASNITVQSATITWNTDEPASSQLDYGTTTSYGSSTPLDTTLVTSHSINLGGLQPGTTYHYRVRSTDSVGNTTISVDGTFSTDAVVDSTPPVISNVLVSNLTTSTATITWTTNEASNTQVEYGTTNAYGSQSTLNSSPVTSHTVTLTGLDHSTTYHFRVLSADAASNLATGSDLTFTTPILDTANPTAAAVLSNVALGGGGSYDFQVTYSDNVAINGSTLQTGNVVVSGPNSFNSAPVFLSVNTGGDGTPRTATYRLTPPGGSWSESDNGVYTLSMAANQVKDTSGNEVSSGTLATFSVNVDLTPPIAGTPEVTADGNAIVMTLSEPSAPFLGSGGFSLNGSLQASAEDWSISGTTLTLQLNGTVLQSEDNLLLSYNGAGGIIDASGNKMLAFSGRPVVNSSVQTAISLTAPTPVPVAAYQDRLFVVFATAQGVGTIQYKAQIALDHDGSPGDWSDGTDFSDSRSIVINNLESSTRYWVRIVTQDALGRTATGSVAIMSTNSLIFGQIPHVPDYVVRTEQRLMQQALHIFDSGQLNGIVDWVAIFKLTNRFARK
jgi:phosphodiesterase/alkaline phosphatase D-like protein